MTDFYQMLCDIKDELLQTTEQGREQVEVHGRQHSDTRHLKKKTSLHLITQQYIQTI